jgi:hypothetical protein
MEVQLARYPLPCFTRRGVRRERVTVPSPIWLVPFHPQHHTLR